MIRIDPKTVAGLLAGLLSATIVLAHDGDAEDRAMKMLGLLQQMDRSWAAQAREADPARRAAQLAMHARALREAQHALRDAADKSPCVMLESRDADRQLACLIDTEARLRASERLLEHLVNRMTLTEP